MRNASLKRYLNIKILLMVMVIAQPIGAMDHDTSELWSLIKGHPVLAATAAVGIGVMSVWAVKKHNQQTREPAKQAASGTTLQTEAETGVLKLALLQGENESILIKRLLVAVQQGNEDEAEICLDSGIRPTVDFLRIAIDSDQKSIIVVFTKHGVTALTEVDSQPVLLRALKKRATNTIAYLLRYGKEDIMPVLEHPDFNFAEHKETFQQALHGLSSAGHANALRWLCGQKGIDDWAFDSQKYRLIHRAAEAGQVAVIKLCLERRKYDACLIGPENVTPIMLAAGSGNVEAVQLLWDNDGFHPGAVDHNHMTPLAHAAAKGHLEVVRRLVELIKVNHPSCSLDGPFHDVATPLHHAIYTEQYEVATYLLGQGASVLSVDAQGDTPLFAAVKVKRKFDVPFMQLLINASKDQLVLNKDGHPVTYIALQYGNRQAHDMLIAVGAKTAKELAAPK